MSGLGIKQTGSWLFNEPEELNATLPEGSFQIVPETPSLWQAQKPCTTPGTRLDFSCKKSRRVIIIMYGVEWSIAIFDSMY